MDKNYAAQLFAYKHLPPHLQEVSEEFYTLAMYLFAPELNPHMNPIERTVALRALLSAKNTTIHTKILNPKLNP